MQPSQDAQTDAVSKFSGLRPSEDPAHTVCNACVHRLLQWTVIKNEMVRPRKMSGCMTDFPSLLFCPFTGENNAFWDMMGWDRINLVQPPDSGS